MSHDHVTCDMTQVPCAARGIINFVHREEQMGGKYWDCDYSEH